MEEEALAKIAIVTDSNSGITQRQAAELGISVVPMPFDIDGKTYYEDMLPDVRLHIFVICFSIYIKWHRYYGYSQLRCLSLGNSAVTVCYNRYFCQSFFLQIYLTKVFSCLYILTQNA